MSTDCCPPVVGCCEEPKPRLFLFHIRQDVNNGYDTYSDAVVVAESEEQARKIHPRHGLLADVLTDKDKHPLWDWVLPREVKTKLVGEATEGLKAGDVVCSSFHAG